MTLSRQVFEWSKWLKRQKIATLVMFYGLLLNICDIEINIDDSCRFFNAQNGSGFQISLSRQIF